MSKPEYVPGEHVTVYLADAQVLEYIGEHIVGIDPAPAEIVVRPRNSDDSVRLRIGDRYGTKLDRKIPHDGMPMPGELWRDAAGELYFAKDNGARDVNFVTPGNTSIWALSWQDIHREKGPIERVWSPAGGGTDAG